MSPNRSRSRSWLAPLAVAALAASLAVGAPPPAGAEPGENLQEKPGHFDDGHTHEAAQGHDEKQEGKQDKKGGAKAHKLEQGPVELPKGETAPLESAREEAVASPPAAAVAAVSAPPDSVDLRALVLASDGTESDLPAIRQALEYLGTPYDLFVAAPAPSDPAVNRLADQASGAVQLTDGDLTAATRGRYNAVILTTGSLGYAGDAGYQSALTPAEWSHLWAYEAKFKVRQVSWYTYPSADFGFEPPTAAVDTSTTPIVAPFTVAGEEIFSSYANTSTPVSIRHAYTYLAQPLADGMTTPVLSDDAGNALVAIRSYPDGREGMALTFDSNRYLLHNLVLSYGLVNWATRGLFLGARRVYLNAQIDDVFIHSTVWQPGTVCGTSPFDPALPVYRMTGDDLAQVEAWQAAKQAVAPTQGLRLSMAFNGFGTTAEYYDDYVTRYPGTPAVDSLTPRARSNQSLFNWVSHTYTHENLDAIGATQAQQELARNDTVARSLGLTRYKKANLVTPEVSGLANPTFLTKASSFGIRNLVSDVSRGGTSANPSPNAGNYNALQPNILQIPRRANNLYFNVSTPAEWLAEDNCLYPLGAYGHVDTYEQLLERESNVLMSYLLLGDIDPWMFHQANLRSYDGTHALATDLLDLTLAKYSTYFTLPVLSPTMDELAVRMTDWMKYVSSGATATASGSPGSTPLTLTVAQAATVPVNGVKGPVFEEYGGQFTTRISVTPGAPVILGPAPMLTPVDLDFGTVKTGKATAPKSVTLINSGNMAMSVTGITASGDFTQTNTCGTAVAAGARCTIRVTFKPTALGSRTGSLVVSGNVPTSPSTVTLRGVGAKP